MWEVQRSRFYPADYLNQGGVVDTVYYLPGFGVRPAIDLHEQIVFVGNVQIFYEWM
jgi:hypothetical protein